MYTIMAKAEEVTQAMKSVQSHASRMYPFLRKFFRINEKLILNFLYRKEIKRLVDLFESYC